MNIFFSFLALTFFLIYQALTSSVLIFIPRRFRRKKDIKGQRILITGAGNGVGRQLAIEFSKHSTCLVLVDINRQSLMETEKLLDRRSAVFIYDCDVSDYKKVCEMAKKVREEAGDVNILVNNAAIVSGKHLLDLQQEEMIKTMEVNAFSHFWTAKAFLPSMIEINRGHIVSIASIVGKCGVPKLTDYCASKFAVIGFAEALEIEMREQELDGIKVTIVYPYHIDTGMFKGFKLKGLGPMTPEYVAKEVVDGILEEKEIIVLPHFLRLACVIKEVLARWMFITLAEISGNLKVMENFTGREPKSVNKPVKAD